MAEQERDWLRVVFGSGLDPSESAEEEVGPTEITVRQVPGRIDLRSAPRREQGVRVTVVPSKPGTAWELYLRERVSVPAEPREGRIWWRVEPGTWQPMTGSSQCVAAGRGRVRVDVSLRLEGRWSRRPRLDFVTEAAD